jgi:hypothetical protein
MMLHLCHFLVNKFLPNPTKKKDACYKFCNSAQDYSISGRCLSSISTLYCSSPAHNKLKAEEEFTWTPFSILHSKHSTLAKTVFLSTTPFQRPKTKWRHCRSCLKILAVRHVVNAVFRTG